MFRMTILIGNDNTDWESFVKKKKKMKMTFKGVEYLCKPLCIPLML